MLENLYFLEKKNVKIASASGANPRLPPVAGSPAPRRHIFALSHYDNFVELIPSAKCILLS